MKKENRKLAQQRRAQERQKQEKNQKAEEISGLVYTRYHHPASGHYSGGRRRKKFRL